MALTSAKYPSTTEDAPRGWVVNPTATIYPGAIFGRYRSGSLKGYADNIGAGPDMEVLGVNLRLYGGALAAGHLFTPSPEVIADEVVLPLSIPGGITTADRNAIVYGIDENTGSLSPADGPPIGVLFEVKSSTVGKVGVGPSFLARAVHALHASGITTARAVVTSLAACASASGVLTATANGAIGTQDSAVTLAVGDLVFVPKGTTNLPAATDAGPYIVAAVGTSGAKFRLVRPWWFGQGSIPAQGIQINIGGEGTLYGGSAWKSFGAAGLVVGTGDFLFWPNKLTKRVTLASGTLASALATLPVRDAQLSGISVASMPTVAPNSSTRFVRVSALTAGDMNTASIQVVAESAPGTTNTSDVGAYNVTVENW